MEPRWRESGLLWRRFPAPGFRRFSARLRTLRSAEQRGVVELLRITNRVIVVVAFAAALVGCSEGGTGKSGEKAPTVVGGVVEPLRFTDPLEAVGLASATDPTGHTSTVTDTGA